MRAVLACPAQITRLIRTIAGASRGPAAMISFALSAIEVPVIFAA
jgi:hypothetical protein